MLPKTKALGILMRGRQILVERFEGAHSKGTGVYFRPIGGTIEFGEYSRQTIVREYFEELRVENLCFEYLQPRQHIPYRHFPICLLQSLFVFP